MNVKLLAVTAIFAFVSSSAANVRLYELTGDGWSLVALIGAVIGAVGTAVALAIPSLW